MSDFCPPGGSSRLAEATASVARRNSISCSNSRSRAARYCRDSPGSAMLMSSPLVSRPTRGRIDAAADAIPDSTSSRLRTNRSVPPVPQIADSTSSAANGPNDSPDIQHSTVEHPMAGTWTAQIVWADGRGHVQSPPNTPGPYTGTVTFQASGQNFTTSPASAPVTIRPHSSVSVPLSIALPRTRRRCPRVGAVHGTERARELGADRPAYRSSRHVVAPSAPH